MKSHYEKHQIIEEIRNRKLFYVCLIFLVFSFLWVQFGTEGYLKEYFQSEVAKYLSEGEQVTVSGELYQKEEAKSYQILYLKNCNIAQGQTVYKEKRMMVYEKENLAYKIGNTICVTGRLHFFEDARNPGNFSQKAYYLIRKIQVSVWCDTSRCVDTHVKVVPEYLLRLRKNWGSWILKAAGEEDGTTLSAMLLGEKRQMDTELKELYQVNGIAHILAISGLHLSFVGISFYRLVRRMTGSYFISGLLGMIFLVSYVLMIGVTVSAVRAMVMFCIRVGADMSGRVYDAPTAYMTAAASVILWRPLSFYDAGFQLSFGAIGGMIFLYPLLCTRVNKLFSASLSIQLMTLPMLLWHYFEFPFYAIFLNLIIIPLMSVILFLGFSGSVAGLLSDRIGQVMLFPCKVILRLYKLLCTCVMRFPMYQTITGRPKLVGILIYYACLMVVMLLIASTMKKDKENSNTFTLKSSETLNKRRNIKNDITIKIFLLANVVLLMLFCPRFRHPDFEATFLDVGQGDGIFVREKRGISMLVDGGSSDVKRVGQYRIESFLKERGVDRLDYIFVSHGDFDHICGIEELLKRQAIGVKISALVFPEIIYWDEKLEALALLARKYGVHVYEVKEGEIIRGKELSLLCLSPPRSIEKEASSELEIGNETSMVLSLSYGELELLLTGDVEGKGELALLDRQKSIDSSVAQNEGDLKECPRLRVLKVAHHGSRFSSTEEFLDAYDPNVAIISAGVNSRYGHPHPETVERLRNRNIKIFATPQSKAISLLLSGKEVENLKIIQYNRVYEKLE